MKEGKRVPLASLPFVAVRKLHCDKPTPYDLNGFEPQDCVWLASMQHTIEKTLAMTSVFQYVFICIVEEDCANENN
jgi:hypothetical protein